MTEDAKCDIENPKLPPETAPPPSDVAATGLGGISSDHRRKWRVIGLGTFVLTAVVLSIALGITLGGDAGGTDSSANASGSDSENVALDYAGEFGQYGTCQSRPASRNLDSNDAFFIAPIVNIL